jgi:hypothetical protein
MSGGVVEAALWPPQAPTLRDFLVSPGFAGAGIALAAIVLLFAVLYTSRRADGRLDRQLDQLDHYQQEDRADRERSAGVERCWQRLVWLVNAAAIEPTGLGLDHSEEAHLGLSPELTLAILKGLHRDATELGDDTLVEAVTVYLTQFGSVLTQEGGPVADTSVFNGHQEKPVAAAEADATPAPATETPVSAPAETAAYKGRRRA